MTAIPPRKRKTARSSLRKVARKLGVKFAATKRTARDERTP